MPTSKHPIRLKLLADEESFIPELTKWFIAEWEPYYGPNGPGDAGADLRSCLNHGSLPLAVVALNAGGGLLGTAALKHESVGSELGVGPWLAAFLVGPGHRGKGVGTELVGAIEREAARLGYEFVYTSTDAADGILQRRGWQMFGETTSLRGPLTIYRLSVGG